MYQRASDFDAKNPDTLRQQLQRMDNSIDQAFRSVVSPRLIVRRASADIAASYGELIIVDSTNSSIVVKLPRVDQRDAGNKPIVVARVSSANTITVLPEAPDQINRAISLTLSSTVGVRVTIYCDGLEFWA